MFSTIPSVLVGLIKSVIPNFVASSVLSSFISMPIILLAPTILAPCITFNPIPPRPNTTTLDPASTFAS